MGVKCPFCQTENDSAVIFCYQCGTEISKDIIKSTYPTFPKTSLKDIMKFTLKKMVQISFMMLIMILCAMMLTDLFRK